MALNAKQRQFLKAEAHALNPVVMLGADGIKIKLNAGEGRKEQAQQAADAVKAELVSVVGRVAILFRQRKDDSRFILPR